MTTGRFDQDLRDHLSRCQVCADLAAVTAALQESRADAVADARVPAAGLVWWRMELRARHEAARTAARPITIAQTFAAACGLVLAVALLSAAWPFVSRWSALEPVATTLRGVMPQGGIANLTTLPLPSTLPLAFALLAWVIVAPLALYFVFSDD